MSTVSIDAPLTEAKIVALLMRDRKQRSFIIPRYTPQNWWENDVFEITPAGYWREYEIKLTRADYRRDVQKKNEKWQGWQQPRLTESKHELLTAGERGPCQFYYVAPVNVLKVEDMPEWAGLIRVMNDGPRLWESIAKEAPRRHKNKIDDAVRRHALGVCYWRYLALLK